MKKNKKTFRFHCVIKGCKLDFGMGIGVICQQEVSYTDENNKGFNDPKFYLEMQGDADKLLKECCTVLVEPKVKGKKWDKDPKKTHEIF